MSSEKDSILEQEGSGRNNVGRFGHLAFSHGQLTTLGKRLWAPKQEFPVPKSGILSIRQEVTGVLFRCQKMLPLKTGFVMHKFVSYFFIFFRPTEQSSHSCQTQAEMESVTRIMIYQSCCKKGY